VKISSLLKRALPWLVLALSPVYIVAIVSAFVRVPPELLRASAGYEQSARFLDRNDHVLRELRAGDTTRASWVSLEDAGENVPLAILAAEDQRFELHGGVDPVAVIRAALGDLFARKITSGASTLTMQLARLVRPHRRNLLGKIGEAALAVRIEDALTKDQILAEYINCAPFGPNLRGIDAASRFYFDKPPRELSLAEAATLAAIPRGPEVYALDKHADRALRRRNRILERMHRAGKISDDAFERASHEPLFVTKHTPTFGAPHLIAALAQGTLDPSLPPLHSGDVHTTISSELQGEAEQAALSTIASLRKKNVTAASVLVIDNASGDVLAYVGSPDFFDAKNGGQNDGVRARRQPGSTLKPFLYGLAMEKLNFTAATALPDVEMELPLLTGAYEPMNYDERFHGPVRLREALANSYNVPAVWTATQIGPGPLLDRLHDLGMGSLTEAADYYGPALALGDGEVSLLELTNAYATLARGGVWKPIRFVADLPSDDADSRRVMPATVANMLADILKDKNARLASFGERSVLELPFDVAAKTGTSKGFRDNWTVGFTHEVTVGVWVGNFDGSAMDGVSGITGAGPIFRSVMQSAMQSREPQPIGAVVSADDLVRTEVCPLSGDAPTAACKHRIFEWIPRVHAPLDACTMHEFVRIDSRNGERADGCAGTSITQKSFETFPPELEAWARAAHRELAPQTQSPLCGGASRSSHDLALRIASPNDGASYVLDPSRPFSTQSLAVRINAPPDATHVRLRVDGHVLADADATHRVRWNLSPGAHVLVAEADGNSTSAPIRVTVQ
jgi:penicillin-binding protein 1C